MRLKLLTSVKTDFFTLDLYSFYSNTDVSVCNVKGLLISDNFDTGDTMSAYFSVVNAFPCCSPHIHLLGSPLREKSVSVAAIAETFGLSCR